MENIVSIRQLSKICSIPTAEIRAVALAGFFGKGYSNKGFDFTHPRVLEFISAYTIDSTITAMGDDQKLFLDIFLKRLRQLLSVDAIVLARRLCREYRFEGNVKPEDLLGPIRETFIKATLDIREGVIWEFAEHKEGRNNDDKAE